MSRRLYPNSRRVLARRTAQTLRLLRESAWTRRLCDRFGDQMGINIVGALASFAYGEDRSPQWALYTLMKFSEFLTSGGNGDLATELAPIINKLQMLYRRMRRPEL